MHKNTPLVLMILDGWGFSEKSEHNAINLAPTPQWDEWWHTRPHVLLEASGTPVGLPDQQMGNSEVGHMHIGAGRVIPQDFTRINQAIASGDFSTNPVFLKAINDMKATSKTIHVWGLLSQGGVHSHEDHLYAFLALCEKQHFSNVVLHLFLDGRDTPPQSARSNLTTLMSFLEHHPVATIGSITGRYYAMDRDKRWARVAPVYQLLTTAESPHHFSTALEALDSFYKQHIYDEFIPPTRMDALRPIMTGDTVFFFNFRSDRARQLTQALIADQFDGFERSTRPKISQFISMTPYAKHLVTQSAFPQQPLHNTLGEVLAHHNLRQLRIAETEKYAHVTFFLNGGSEQVFPLEERILIPSPAVATYDLQPEMNAAIVADTIIKALHAQRYDVIICNFANADMVGHSGNMEATVQAIATLDKVMHDIGAAVQKVNGQLLITADHGNAECMYDESTQQAHTAHTHHPVPFVYVGHADWQINAQTGSLIDIAPTVLTLLGIQPPNDMQGKTLLVKKHAN